MTTRAKQLDTALDVACRELEAWLEDDSSGHGVMPSSRLWLAMQALVGAFRDGDMPVSHREIDRSVYNIAIMWNRFAEQQAVQLDADAAPERSFFTAMQQLFAQRDSLRPVKYSPMPGLNHLINNERIKNLGHLASILDWRDSRGELDTARVSDEIRKGSKSKYWESAPDPRNKKLEESRDDWRQSLERLSESTEKKLNRSSPSAPESLAELVSQGVSLSQIANILDLDVSEVEQQCRENQLPIPGMAYDHENSPAAQVMEEIDDPGDLPIAPQDERSQVIGYMRMHPEARDGEIADAVGVSRQKVTQIRKGQEAQEEQTEPGDEVVSAPVE